ncbi:Snf1 kinase complex beta-subunit Gal83 [Histoplasma capsulatum var. duboisii H88]|uniref:Snf1 kinase complex beta-subunit Gal83 n=1 Tax=Ajellomyces capsulatus (strain H88) TaxID=544711 RepID=A0A8A1L8I1_AJEC8|nr:Snf1 kinase complex beta-subunit Gal83 [Histoplasma capsulatum var. duboisii H88]
MPSRAQQALAANRPQPIRLPLAKVPLAIRSRTDSRPLSNTGCSPVTSLTPQDMTPTSTSNYGIEIPNDTSEKTAISASISLPAAREIPPKHPLKQSPSPPRRTGVRGLPAIQASLPM